MKKFDFTLSTAFHCFCLSHHHHIVSLSSVERAQRVCVAVCSAALDHFVEAGGVVAPPYEEEMAAAATNSTMAPATTTTTVGIGGRGGGGGGGQVGVNNHG